MTTRRQLLAAAPALLSLGMLSACGPGTGGSDSVKTLRISAIPDQDPELLTEREEALAKYLSEKLTDIAVEYVPVPDYAASVAQLDTGDLDLVFYGGLTGVQARLMNPEVRVLAQRDIDEKFTSIFIAHRDAQIAPFTEVAGLSAFKGRRFTFGSETSTSGRLMPSSFLAEAGVKETDLEGEPGFSGSHDSTIELVTAGTYEGGAVNSQVWKSRLEAGEIDTDSVIAVFETPQYHDYHWILRADAASTFGEGFEEQLKNALLSMHESQDGKAVLEKYGAATIIETVPENYARIEEAARELGLLG